MSHIIIKGVASFYVIKKVFLHNGHEAKHQGEKLQLGSPCESNINVTQKLKS